MWRLGRMLPRTLLLALSILLGTYLASVAPVPGNVLAWEQATPRTGVMRAGAGWAGRTPAPAALPALHMRSANRPFISAAARRAAVARVPAAPTRGAGLSVVSLMATPLRVAPLDTVTFAATLFNGGFMCGPYRATLQLLPEHGDRLRSLTQSGFMLRHDQRLTLYWEWRAGAALPTGIYAMRVRVGPVAWPTCMVASYTARQRLTVVPR